MTPTVLGLMAREIKDADTPRVRFRAEIEQEKERMVFCYREGSWKKGCHPAVKCRGFL